LSCDFACDAGYFSEVSISNRQLECKPCPSGTYNRGGGLRFGQGGIPWSNYDSYFKSYCWTSEWISWSLGKNCTEWEVKDSYLTSGSSKEKAWYMLELSIPARLVKPGNLTVEYYKETRKYDDSPNGELAIVVDDSEVWYDAVSSVDKDMAISIPINAGIHIVKLVYLKYNAKEMTDLGITIKKLEISGARYSSTVCYPCEKGFSTPGSVECDLCDHDTYWSATDKQCINCPDGKYSLPGAISASDCKARSACSAKDYRVSVTPCTNGKRQRIYEWNQPHICNQAEGVSLPANVEINCTVCEPGQYFNITDSEVKCLECPSGYISSDGSETCLPCPAGHSSNDKHDACIECPGIQYSETSGTTCKECPQHTRLNANSTSCVGLRFVAFDESTYYISNLTGIYENGTQTIPDICSRSSYQLYCYNTFYGPIEGSGKIFYLSLLNPSLLTMSQYPSLDNLSYGYGYAILKKGDLQYSPMNINSTTSLCSNSDNVLVNIGTSVASLQDNNDGMTILYKNGSVSDPKTGAKFSSSIQLVCDKEQEVGWPVLTSYNSSHFSFIWKNRYGCPICQPEDMLTVEGWCSEGFRWVSMFEGKNCIFVGDRNYLSWKEPCDVTEEIIGTWPFILGFVAFMLVCGLTVLITVCFCKTRRKYRRLIEARMSNFSGGT
jgi:hypothetical protein